MRTSWRDRFQSFETTDFLRIVSYSLFIYLLFVGNFENFAGSVDLKKNQLSKQKREVPNGLQHCVLLIRLYAAMLLCQTRSVPATRGLGPMRVAFGVPSSRMQRD